MLKMFSLALKNTGRNTRRTVLTATASFISVLVVVIILAFMLSMMDDMEEINVLHMTGHVRLRKSGYTKYEDVQPLQFYIEDAGKLASEIRKIDTVRHVEVLSRIAVSVYADEELKTGYMLAVDSKDSAFLTGKGANLAEGRLIEDREHEIVASPGFLRKFGKTPGDSVTIITRTANGGTNGASFRIVGVIDSNDAELNNDVIYVDFERAARLAHMDGGALELLVVLDSDGSIETAIASIQEELEDLDYDPKAFEVASWHDISVFYPMVTVYELMLGLIEVVFFFIASTLIINTTMMSVLERTREVSTMAALGFERRGIRALFILEAAIISAAGSALAAVLGKIIVLVTGKTGIDIRMFGAGDVEGWGFPKFLYPHLSDSWYLITAVLMVLVSVAASFIATRRIRKIEIADALRDEN